MSSSQVLFLRKFDGSRLNVFAPVSDLSLLSKTSSGSPDKMNGVTIAGGQVLGDEYSEHVVKVGFFAVIYLVSMVD